MATRDSRTQLPAPATDGLSAIDRDRAGSLADEGGTSAATLESHEGPAEVHDKGTPPRERRWPIAVGIGVGAVATWRLLRGRGAREERS
jgi:hypothetical protein